MQTVMKASQDMVNVVPRWEWRAFGQCFGSAERLLGNLTPNGLEESDEVYLLTSAGSNVKIRDALVDVKVKRDVNADGLEQWTPIIKAAFPLSKYEASKVLQAMDVSPTNELLNGCTLEVLLKRLAAPDSSSRLIKVHKRRTRYTVDGCMAELSEIVTENKSTRTIAVESVDAAAVAHVVAELGLSGYTNTNYPKGLKALIDGKPERFAVIDVGTNSIKFYIGERSADGNWHTVADRAEMTRLGEGLSCGGDISHAAIKRTVSAISGMAE
jgi:exopolyphosphatase/guanosine-5'-triphosphate,3'-diphosphate pyrophosphatase